MTVTTTNLTNSGTGNGSNKNFAFTFRVLADTDLVVTNAGAAQTLNTHYTVSRNTSGEGGTVIFVTAPTNGAAIVIGRQLPLTQGLGLVRQGNVPKADLENELDKLTLLIQQVQGLISASGVSGPGSSVNDNSIVLWNGTGGTSVKDGVALGTSGQVLTSNGAGNAPSFQTLAGSGTVTSFSAGDLSPLFTTSEANVTTTPALTFSLSNAAANTVFGNNTGSTAAPAFQSMSTGQLPTVPETKGGTNQTTFTTGDILYASGANTLSKLAIGSAGQVLLVSGGVPAWGAAGTGTVTSFSAGDLSPLFTTSEANVTTTPALTFTLSNAAANTVFGNATGSSAAPSFGAIVNGQLPIVDQSHGGTAFSSYTDGDIIVVNASGNLVKLPIGANGEVLSVNTGNNPKFDWVAAGSGTVTSFSAGDLSPLFTTSEANTTTTPALTFTLSNAAANTVFGNNTGSSAAPAFQTLAAGQLGLTTAGDILCLNDTPALTRLGLGTNGQVLTVDTALNPKLKWSTPAGGGDVVGPATSTRYSVALFDNTSGDLLTEVSGLGTSGQILTSNGAGVAPTWQANAGGGGTVTNFSAGDLSPLFTTSEANTTTTPALTFSLSNAAANTVFGNNTGSTAAPAFQSLAVGQLPTVTTAKGGTGLTSIGTALQILRVNSGASALEYAPPQISVGTFNARLTLESGVGVSSSDQSAKTTVYLTPYLGSTIWLKTSSVWTAYTLTEISASLASLTNDLPYDVFVYDNSGTLALDLVAWTNATTRATAIEVIDGVPCKNGTSGARRLAGTLRMSATGQCSDTMSFRGVCNVYNRELRPLRAFDTTNSWTYGSTSFRTFNNSTTLGVGKASFVTSLASYSAHLSANACAGSSNRVGVGIDSTTVNSTHLNGFASAFGAWSVYNGNIAAVGNHDVYPLEASSSGTSQTFLGDNGEASNGFQSGLAGHVWM